MVQPGSDPALDPERAMTLGPWRLLRILGQGGMGHVYEATDDRGRSVAVKVLDRMLAGEGRHAERFRREAEILARLDHPGVLSFLESGEDAGVPYIVTHLVLGTDGEPTTLESALREGSLDLATALDLFADMLDGLAHAHERGIIHRDVKPSNLLIARLREGRPRATLADFGVAAIVGATNDLLFERGSNPGTARYMAPEQRTTPARIDARSDIYSAGVFLHEILTGHPPTDGIATLEGALAPYVEVIERALRHTPTDRFGDVGEFADALAIARAHPARRLSEEDRAALAAGHLARALEFELEGSPVAARRHRLVARHLEGGPASGSRASAWVRESRR